MAGDFGRDIGSERGGADFNIAEVAIESGERGACADDAEINGVATGLAKVILCCIHQFAAHASALAGRIDAEQS